MALIIGTVFTIHLTCANESSSLASERFEHEGILYLVSPYNDSEAFLDMGEQVGNILNIPSNVPYKGSTLTVTAILDDAFYYNKGLESVTIPGTIKQIGAGAFIGCESLKDVTLNEGLESISAFAFGRCESLVSIRIPSTVTTINAMAFEYDISLRAIHVESGNAKYSSVEGVLFSKGGTELIECPENRDGDYRIPDGVKIVEHRSFRDCRSITSIHVPDTVTTIGNDAFFGCKSITSISLGKNILSIGGNVFKDCSELESIDVADDNPMYTSVSGALFDKAVTTIIKCPEAMGGSYDIPSTVTTITEWSFSNCSGLTGVSIPEGVGYIGSHSFYECSGLTSVTLPRSATYISMEMFYGCTNMEHIQIGMNVRSIGDGAFHNCSSIRSLYIPAAVESIGTDVFDGCLALREILVSELNPYYTSFDGVLFDEEGTELLKCPMNFSGGFEIPDTTTTIYQHAFEDCVNLTSVSIGQSVIYIGKYAFSGCSALTRVEISESLRELGYCAFSYCSKLTSIDLPDNLMEMGSSAFEGCIGLKSVIFSGNLGVIPYGTFAKCIMLNNIDNIDRVTSIESNSFRECKSLTSFEIPATVEMITGDAFRFCSGMKEFSVEKGNRHYEAIDGVLFEYGGKTLVKYPDGKTGPYSVPDLTESINYDAFYDVSGLTEVIIPANVQIDGNSFLGCTNLTHITIIQPNESLCSEGGAIYSKDMTELVYCPSNMDTLVLPSSVKTFGIMSLFRANPERIVVCGGDSIICALESTLDCSTDIQFVSGRDGYVLETYADSEHTIRLSMEELAACNVGTIYFKWIEVPPDGESSHTRHIAILSMIIMAVAALCAIYKKK